MKLDRILVWDAPTRVFHWLLAFCFAGAYITSEGHGSMLTVHLTLGYSMLGLVGFRLLWGLMGTRYARFAQFVPSLEATTRYARELLSGRAPRCVGHNPLGAWSIVAMLVGSAAVVGSGWIYFSLGAHALKEAHEAVAALMLMLVCVHVGAVALTSLTGDENLVTAMINGHKWGARQDGIRWSWWPVALLLCMGVSGFWWYQATAANPVGANGAALRSAGGHGDPDRWHHEEDD